MATVLRPYQNKFKQDIYEAWQSGHQNVLAVLPTGGGKCLGENTPVLMFDGSIKQVQDVIEGDLLMGPDSTTRKVLSVCQGYSNLFRVVPTKGESWVCNDAHVLTLKHTETNEILDIDLPNYFTTTKWFKHLHKQFRVGVEFNAKPTQFDPYLVGLYLAEGSWSNPHVTNPDWEIITYLYRWAETNEMKINFTHGQGCLEMSFADFKQGWGKNKIRNLAKCCTSQNDRWVPKDYLINDRNTRLKVLAGLLDGDGHYSDHGGFEIITKYTSLNRDILFLARSLGFAAYSKKKIATIKSINFSGEYYRITINGHLDQIPTRVRRKQARPRLQKKDVLKTGFKIEALGEGKYYGFELSGDGRFLLGDFTVTHNTRSFCSIAIDFAVAPIQGKRPTAIMVHRKELVQQISLTLAEEGIVHNIIAPRPTIQGIIAAQRLMFNKQFYDYNSLVTVLSVDTLNARIEKHDKWTKTIQFWITDEAAHLLKNNKWGKAVSYFPNAIGLGVTATPERLDKRGLGRHADGVFDTMVEGPSVRWLIENGFLCNYKIAVPQSDYRHYLQKAGSGADYSHEAMAAAAAQSQITGDVVTNYQKFADGKQAILFASDIISGSKMEAKFKEAGISAKLLTGCTDDRVRLNSLNEYRDKKIKVLLNVDLFDEGLDVPGIECVIMARPTMSIGKFRQMVGRGLRPAKGKDFLIIIDHVGNVPEHGLPDSHYSWTLDRIVKKRDRVNLIRICSNWQCNSPYDRLLTECPYCGTKFEPSRSGGSGSRPTPLEVDGDLELLDSETLREMYDKSKLETPEEIMKRVTKAAGVPAGKRAFKNQIERIETQKELTEVVAQWAGVIRARGYSDRHINKKFYLDFGMTITEALSKPKAEMLEIMEELRGSYEIRSRVPTDKDNRFLGGETSRLA